MKLKENEFRVNTSVNDSTGMCHHRTASKISMMSTMLWKTMPSTAKDCSSPRTSNTVVGAREVNGFAVWVVREKTESKSSRETGSVSCVDHFCFVGSFERLHAARNGPAEMNPQQIMRSKWVGLSCASMFLSMPKRRCQNMSATPPMAKPHTPSTESSYPAGTAFCQVAPSASLST